MNSDGEDDQANVEQTKPSDVLHERAAPQASKGFQDKRKVDEDDEDYISDDGLPNPSNLNLSELLQQKPQSFMGALENKSKKSYYITEKPIM